MSNSFAIAKEAKTDVSAAKIITLVNPSTSYGVHIGDKLTRKMVLKVPAAYQISTFPKKGTKNNGVELVDINIESDQQKTHTLYTVNLSYQLFSSAEKPSIMQLPAEKFALSKGVEPSTLAIPAWHFWFSPLVTGGIEAAQKNLQPDFKPPLVDIQSHQTRFFAFLSMLTISLLALIYINADGEWLPFMGGAFAKAHRQLKRLSKTRHAKSAKDEKQALVYIHQAFNRHYGANIFARDIEHFVTLRPSFRKMKDSIEQFFQASNQSLYATEPRNSAQVIASLVQLSKQLRDCERGI
ncbi:MAG: hypothetical protein V4605_07695 [Pseudomonadota bacterium]